jgi:hypothetical protein
VGDCNDDGAVTIDELLLGVNIALDPALLPECDEFDITEDTRVTVNELVGGVKALLNTCLP